MALDVGAKFSITAGVAGQAQLDRFAASLKDADRNGGMLSSTMGELRGAFAGLSIAAVGATLVAMTKAAIDNADALNDMAERTGIAGEALSELEYAAKMNGTSLEAVETALKKVSTKAFDAATGNKAAAATFDALGISVRATDGSLKSADTLLQDVADVLNTVDDRATRTALAVEIFGRSGAELIPLMQNMREARDEAQRLGIVVSSDMQRASAEFNDNMDRMGFQARAFATSLANDVLPTLNRFFTELTAGREIFGGYWEATKQIGLTNPFNSVAENAEKYRKKLGELQTEMQTLEGNNTRMAASRRNDLREEIENTKKLVEYFQRMNGQTSTAGAGRGSVNPAGANATNPNDLLDRIKAANAGSDKAGGAAKETEFEKLRRQYEDQIMRTQDLSEAEKLLKEIQLGRYKDLTPEQQKQLEAMARDLDYKRMLSEGEKAAADRQRKIASERQTDADRTEAAQKREIERWKELADPAAKFREEIERIREAFAKGLIESDVAGSAIDALDKQIEALNKVKDKGEDTFKSLQDAVEGWGRSATDAFVDFAFGAKSNFSDMISSMLKDLARMVVQQNIMGPLFKSLSGMIGGAGGAGGLGSTIASFFGFADGGIMTNAGPVQLRKYAAGGIANSPQLALYGEAGPEAYVPLPDGRTIPVTMQGGGGNTSVVVNVSTSGAAEAEGGDGKTKQLGAMIAGAVQAEIVKQKRPGGLLAA